MAGPQALDPWLFRGGFRLLLPTLGVHTILTKQAAALQTVRQLRSAIPGRPMAIEAAPSNAIRTARTSNPRSPVSATTLDLIFKVLVSPPSIPVSVSFAFSVSVVVVTLSRSLSPCLRMSVFQKAPTNPADQQSLPPFPSKRSRGSGPRRSGRSPEHSAFSSGRRPSCGGLICFGRQLLNEESTQL